MPPRTRRAPIGDIATRVAEIRKAQDAKKEYEEQLKREEEEEEIARKNAEENLKVEQLKKKEEAKNRREQLKKEGKLLTGKQKMAAQKTEMLRQQIMSSQTYSSRPVTAAAMTQSEMYSSRHRKRVTSQDKIPDKQERSGSVSDVHDSVKLLEKDPGGNMTGVHQEEPTQTNDVSSDDDWENVISISDQHKGPVSVEKSQIPVTFPNPLETLHTSDTQKQKLENSNVERVALPPESYDPRFTDLPICFGNPNSRLRSPIVCIMGHVDTGKTKLLDKIRKTNVQGGEAGGITQQIGATFFPSQTLRNSVQKVSRFSVQNKLKKKWSADVELPGILIIDTPGHEAFNNLRKRGSSLCDIAILVVDIMHGLEPQTIESLNILKEKRCPFVVALNKIDRIFDWKQKVNTPSHESLLSQEKDVQLEFNRRLSEIKVAFSEQSLNTDIYWSPDLNPKKDITIVPTSAISGEGIPDLLAVLVSYSQTILSQRLLRRNLGSVTHRSTIGSTHAVNTTSNPLPKDCIDYRIDCTILEVKTTEGYGTTLDAILLNGVLRENDHICVCTMHGAIITKIRAMLTPKPLREIRVKTLHDYMQHKVLVGSIGLKISAPHLEDAIAGTSIILVREHDDQEMVKKSVMEEFNSLINSFPTDSEGVYVKSSTLGSLEALLHFLGENKIPVAHISLGPVHLIDVRKASVMVEKGREDLAVILAFDIKVKTEAEVEAGKLGVKIMTADIIYHLFDQFKLHMETLDNKKKVELRRLAVFPCILNIIEENVFRKSNPVIVGVEVKEGVLQKGVPLCVVSNNQSTNDSTELEKKRTVVSIGVVASIQKDQSPVDVANVGDKVCIHIEAKPRETILLGRHFSVSDPLVSHISRKSIDILKSHFKSEMRKEHWILVKSLKEMFGIA